MKCQKCEKKCPHLSDLEQVACVLNPNQPPITTCDMDQFSDGHIYNWCSPDGGAARESAHTACSYVLERLTNCMFSHLIRMIDQRKTPFNKKQSMMLHIWQEQTSQQLKKQRTAEMPHKISSKRPLTLVVSRKQPIRVRLYICVYVLCVHVQVRSHLTQISLSFII